ncbi:MAG: DUF411 domain-containing protein [Hyphomicrobiales bacterium]
MKIAYRLAATAMTITMPMPAFAAAIDAVMYKNPTCTCCETYAAYLEKNGFKVELIPTNDLAQIATAAGVPQQLQGCHTIKIGRYIVEGFVPVDQVKKMLITLPEIAGISMPGMPMGIPGMGFDQMPGMEAEVYTTYAFTTDGKEPFVYGTYPSN